MRSKARALLRNPVLIVVPLVLAALGGWNVYLSVVAEAPNRATKNLIPSGSFEDQNPEGLPIGWGISATKEAKYEVELGQKGLHSESALLLKITSLKQGVVEFATPSVKVTPGLTYLYKSYYRSDMPIDVVTAYLYRDGTRELRLARTYPAQRDWSMSGISFEVPRNVRKVQIIQRMSGQGAARFDDAYLERRDGIYIAPYLPDVLPTQELPASLSGGSCVAYAFSYRSQHPVSIRATFRMKDKAAKEITAGKFGPAEHATRAVVVFEAPQKALRLEKLRPAGEGNASIYEPVTYNCNKRGQKEFARPLVSIVLDGNSKTEAMVVPRLLEWRQVRATFYLSVSGKKSGAMDARDASLLQKAGHQLALYEPRDLSIVGHGQMGRWLALGQGEIRERWQLANVDVATPNDQDDPEARNYIERYFRSRRGQKQGINKLQSFDPYDVRTVHVTSKTTTKELEALLEETKQGNGWLILAYTAVSDGTKDAVGTHEFETHLKRIKESRIKTVTIEEGLQYTR